MRVDWMLRLLLRLSPIPYPRVLRKPPQRELSDAIRLLEWQPVSRAFDALVAPGRLHSLLRIAHLVLGEKMIAAAPDA